VNQKRASDNRRKLKAKKVLDLIRSAVHSNTALGEIKEISNSDPFRILISTILSARTRDPVTEKASARLFAKYHDARSLAKAEASQVAGIIKPVSFYNVKSKNIVEASKQIVEKFQGKVPRSYAELMELPGVGRKTAGCVLVYGFGEPAIPVDVHVHRIPNRIGLVRTNTPEETEAELISLYDRKYWVDVNELFVSFGQTICRPVGPKCELCPVRRVCKYYRENVQKSG
jgi:endonuclease III